MKLLIVYTVLGFCGLAYALALEDIQQEWLEYLNKYGKNYRSWDENQKRFENFVNNFKLIKQHNERFEKGLVSYKMAVNPFSDMSIKEMEVSHMGLKITENDKQQFRNLKQFEALKAHTYNDIPSTMDWRKAGCITPVKDQKSCGSCWAFASTGALEAQYYLKFNKTVILSEQNLIDCSTENSGCNGGWMISSFEYIRLNEGINPDDKYPYEAVQGKCRYQNRYIAATCSGYRTIAQGDEQALLQAVASKGPIAVAIAANSNFMNYKGGIFDDPTCSQAVNHAVLLIGYGAENGVDYWLVKNSWGSTWGEGGYVKMRRNKQNQCAIASYGSYPVV